MSRIITYLKTQTKNRTNVFLDGELAFSISNSLASNLMIGQEITETQTANLIAQDEFHLAYQRADHFIGYRPRTTREVSRKLLGLKHSERTVEGVIHQLCDHNLLDDKRFAIQWVEERSISSPRGKKMLVRELRQKGVDPEIISETITGIDEKRLALKAARNYVQKRTLPGWDEFRRKIWDFLLRRGFEYSEITTVVEQVWEETGHKK